MTEGTPIDGALFQWMDACRARLQDDTTVFRKVAHESDIMECFALVKILRECGLKTIL